MWFIFGLWWLVLVGRVSGFLFRRVMVCVFVGWRI